MQDGISDALDAVVHSEAKVVCLQEYGPAFPALPAPMLRRSKTGRMQERVAEPIESGSGGRTRTYDTRIMIPLL